MNYSLTNKTALITGASGLLGAQHCKALLEIGCNLVITDVNMSKLTVLSQKLQKQYPQQDIRLFEMDVSNEQSVQSVVYSIQLEQIQIDILINNAAINPSITLQGLENSARLEFFEIDDWNKQLAVGLTGAFLCCKHIGYLISQNVDGGVILNIASDLSVIAPDQRLYSDPTEQEASRLVKPISYSVIKTGLLGLTRYLATYWADKNVRCNALSPGGVQTAEHNYEFVSKLEQLIPMGRMATESDYHGAIQFLCSDASAYLNGQNIIMDGGRSIW